MLASSRQPPPGVAALRTPKDFVMSLNRNPAILFFAFTAETLKG